LQGFPDGWTAEGIDDNGEILTISNTQRYKYLGNAVTVNVVEFIARHIIEMLITTTTPQSEKETFCSGTIEKINLL
jgi:DNA (cytosine-5)-methyltransferase 1